MLSASHVPVSVVPGIWGKSQKLRDRTVNLLGTAIPSAHHPKKSVVSSKLRRLTKAARILPLIWCSSPHGNSTGASEMACIRWFGSADQGTIKDVEGASNQIRARNRRANCEGESCPSFVRYSRVATVVIICKKTCGIPKAPPEDGPGGFGTTVTSETLWSFTPLPQLHRNQARSLTLAPQTQSRHFPVSQSPRSGCCP